VNPFGDAINFAANASNIAPNVPNFVVKILNVIASALKTLQKDRPIPTPRNPFQWGFFFMATPIK
jgi:hypothetical protein